MEFVAIDCSDEHLSAIEKLFAKTDVRDTTPVATGPVATGNSDIALEATSQRQQLTVSEFERLLATDQLPTEIETIFLNSQLFDDATYFDQLSQAPVARSIVVIRTSAHSNQRLRFDWHPIQLPGSTTLLGLNSKQLRVILGLQNGIGARSRPVSDAESQHSKLESAEGCTSDKSRNEVSEHVNSSEGKESSAPFTMGTLAHELRTPLTVIREYADLLDEELLGPLARKQRDSVQVIIDRVDEINFAIDDLIDIQRQTEGALQFHRKSTDVAKLIMSTMAQLDRRARRKNVKLDFHCGRRLPQAFVDSRQIKRALYAVLLDVSSIASPNSKIQVQVDADQETGDVCLRIHTPFWLKHDNQLSPRLAPRNHASNSTNIAEENTIQISSLTRLRRARQVIERNFGVVAFITPASNVDRIAEGRNTNGPSDPASSVIEIRLPATTPESLIDRYATHVHAAFMSTQHATNSTAKLTPVSLFVFEADSSETRLLPIIDDFIHSLQSEWGMVGRVAERKWLWLEQLSQTQRNSLIGRLSSRWEAVRCELPSNELPDIQVQGLATFDLPRETDQLQQVWAEQTAGNMTPETPLGAPSPSKKMRRLLIGDSDLGFSYELMGQLERYGYEVITALNADHFLDSASSESPDAILLNSDLVNEHGEPAWQSLRAIAESAKTPILMLADDIRQQQLGMEQGMAGVFGRNLDSQPIRKKLEEILAGT